ncbi:MAG: enoyl-CoA hydratase-related protein [Nocardioidaceae bacterium]
MTTGSADGSQPEPGEAGQEMSATGMADAVGEAGGLVSLDLASGVATITLDSPSNRNALSRQLVAELTRHLRSAEAADDIRVVVLTHTGNTFCAGADLAEAVEAVEHRGRRGRHGSRQPVHYSACCEQWWCSRSPSSRWFADMSGLAGWDLSGLVTSPW